MFKRINVLINKLINVLKSPSSNTISKLCFNVQNIIVQNNVRSHNVRNVNNVHMCLFSQKQSKNCVLVLEREIPNLKTKT